MEISSPEFVLLTALSFEALKSRFAAAEGDAVKLTEEGSQKTLLHAAAEADDAEKIQWLLENGAQVDAEDAMLRTPLQYAVLAGAQRSAEILLANGADSNREVITADLETSEFLAVSNLPVDSLRHKFTGKEILTVTARQAGSKKTLLHVAAERGEADKVQWLLNNGADIHAMDVMLSTPLQYAALASAENCVEILLGNGADPNMANSFDAYPIHHTATGGSRKIAILLLNHGAMVNVVDKCGSTPLHSAAAACSPGAIPPICSRPECDKEAQDRDGNTPLQVAVRFGNRATPVVAELLRCGCDPNAVDCSGKTPIFHAAKAKASGSVYRLVEADAESRDAPTTFLLAQHYPEILSRIFDAQVTAKRLADTPMAPLAKINFDCSCFLKDSELVQDPANKSLPGFYCILRRIADSDSRSVLAHPLVKYFLFSKWAAAKKLVYINICFTLLTHITLTLLAFGTKRSFPSEVKDEGIFGEDFRSVCWLPFVGLFCLGILAGRETVSALSKGLDYLRLAKNFLDIAWLVSGFLIATNAVFDQTFLITWSHQVAAATVVLGSFETMLALGSCWPTLGEYVTIFVVVLKNFVVYSAAYLSLIVGFGLGFHVLFPWKEGFKSAWTSMARALVMMSGELEFSSTFFDTQDGTAGEDQTAAKSPASLLGPLSMLVFLLFVVIMSVILMNLLIGLTVSDIQSLSYQAQSSRLVVLLDTLIETHSVYQFIQNLCARSGGKSVPKLRKFSVGPTEEEENHGESKTDLDLTLVGRKNLGGEWLQLLEECKRLLNEKEAREAERTAAQMDSKSKLLDGGDLKIEFLSRLVAGLEAFDSFSRESREHTTQKLGALKKNLENLSVYIHSSKPRHQTKKTVSCYKPSLKNKKIPVVEKRIGNFPEHDEGFSKDGCKTCQRNEAPSGCTQTPQLGNLAPLRIPKSTCITKNLVYIVGCTQCQIFYIGRTGRSWRRSVAEHQLKPNDIDRSGEGFKSAVRLHFYREHKSNKGFWSAPLEVLPKNGEDGGKKWIQELKPSLNQAQIQLDAIWNVRENKNRTS